MSISEPQTRSSSDIELRSIQPPLERVRFSSPISETNSENRTANPITMVEPPTPAYFPPSNDIPPIQSSDAGLLEYTRLHGRSEIPLSSRQREGDRTSVHASEASYAEALPDYRADTIPPTYSHSRHDSGEPLTWPAISFRIGFRAFFHTKLNEISVNLTLFPLRLRQCFHFSGFLGLLR